MLCENAYADDYGGLDSEKDTEDEVEAVIRFFPEVLSRSSYRLGRFPIHFLTCGFDESGRLLCNLKAVSCIPLVARLATEFGCFDEAYRGGLLIEDRHVYTAMQNLMIIDQTTPFHQ
jgi:hypothetical protein